MNYKLILIQLLAMGVSASVAPPSEPKKQRAISARQYFYMMSGEWP